MTFTCRCSSGEQNNERGCTPAYDPRSGHIYCANDGDCTQCTATISTEPGEGG